MRKCREQSLPTDGSEWPKERLAAWATARPEEPRIEAELRRTLLVMVLEGTAMPDGTDADGNPTFRFR